VQRAGGHVVDLRLGDVIGLNLIQHLAIDIVLLIRAILAAGAHAQQPELAQDNARDQGEAERNGKHEDKSLEESRQRHHLVGPTGNQAAHPLDV
jgi:hypothetical protein